MEYQQDQKENDRKNDREKITDKFHGIKKPETTWVSSGEPIRFSFVLCGWPNMPWDS